VKILKLLIILSMAALFAPSALAQDAAADLNMSWRALAGVNGLYFHPEGSEAVRVASPKQASAPVKSDTRVAIKK
jgi:hypothetical protein